MAENRNNKSSFKGEDLLWIKKLRVIDYFTLI